MSTFSLQLSNVRLEPKQCLSGSLICLPFPYTHMTTQHKICYIKRICNIWYEELSIATFLAFSFPTQESKPNSWIREQPGWGWCVRLPETRLTRFTPADLLRPCRCSLQLCLLRPVPGSWISPGLSPWSFYPDDCIVQRRGWPPPHRRWPFSPPAAPASPSPPPPPTPPPSPAAQDLLSAPPGDHGSRLWEA